VPGATHEAPATPKDVFAAKDYPRYLADVKTELTPATPGFPIPIVNVAMVSIALQKTNGWDKEAGKQARELLAGKGDRLMILDAFQMILGDDLTGVTDLFKDRKSELYSGTGVQVIQLLKEHEFPLAADAMLAIIPGRPDARLLALSRIPADKRAPVEQLLREREFTSLVSRQVFTLTALNLVMRPPKGEDVNSKELFALALSLGKDTGVLTFGTVRQLQQAGKVDEALLLAALLTPTDSWDTLSPCRTAAIARASGNFTQGYAIYKDALGNRKSPAVREIRMDSDLFLRFAALAKPDLADLPKLADLQKDGNPLVAGDAFLAEGKFAKAAEQYTLALKDPALALEAWSGLLETDPAAALPQAKAMIDAVLAQKDQTERDLQLAWFGRQLWRAVEREMPPTPNAKPVTIPYPCAHLTAVPGWEGQIATLYDRLLQIAAVACLRPDPLRDGQSLRYPAAVIYSLSNQPERAQQILAFPITYPIPPPPGGWVTSSGTPANEPNKPHQASSPQPGETERWQKDLAAALQRYTAAKTANDAKPQQ
ncbi:MAG TPA: hypothetical protein VGM23_03700, partial [Armatimonadota bacterium]